MLGQWDEAGGDKRDEDIASGAGKEGDAAAMALTRPQINALKRERARTMRITGGRMRPTNVLDLGS